MEERTITVACPKCSTGYRITAEEHPSDAFIAGIRCDECHAGLAIRDERNTTDTVGETISITFEDTAENTDIEATESETDTDASRPFSLPGEDTNTRAVLDAFSEDTPKRTRDVAAEVNIDSEVSWYVSELRQRGFIEKIEVDDGYPQYVLTDDAAALYGSEQ